MERPRRFRRKTIFKKQLQVRLANPRFPGAELHGPLAGCYKIKLRAQGYRLVPGA